MKLKYDFAIQNVAGCRVAVAVGPGSEKCNKVLNLNETGADILALLREEKTEDELVAALLAEYDVTEECLRSDVRALLEQLASAGLLA